MAAIDQGYQAVQAIVTSQATSNLDLKKLKTSFTLTQISLYWLSIDFLNLRLPHINSLNSEVHDTLIPGAGASSLLQFDRCLNNPAIKPDLYSLLPRTLLLIRNNRQNRKLNLDFVEQELDIVGWVEESLRLVIAGHFEPA